MNETQPGTTAASASKIMGRACITIEEVLELFPEARAWVNPADYQRLPFSSRTLYHLAERKWEYVLFPAIPCRLKNGFLSVQMIEEVFKKKFPEVMASTIRTEPTQNIWVPTDLSANYKQLYRVSAYSLNLGYYPQKWFLLSSQVRNFSFIPAPQRMGPIPNRIERSVVYIYAWLLYWRLRERSLFSGRPFPCNDYYAPNKSKAEVVLRMGDAEIMIGQMDNRLKPQMGIVRSLLCFENNKPSK